MPRSADAVRTIDLRPRGAPVATYAAKVQRLCVNGQEVALDRPVVAVIDTGTTGVSVSHGAESEAETRTFTEAGRSRSRSRPLTLTILTL